VGRRRLNYTLHHNGQVLRDGFYVLSYFGLDDPRLLVELERAMNLDDRVVRYLIVKTEAKNVAGGGFREDDPDLIPGVPGQRINQKAAS
jgi:ribosomal protein S6